MGAPSTYATAQQIFLADIARNLFANNQFILQSRNWSANANAKTVNWNQSGGAPATVINGTSALTAVSRTDVLRSYNLFEIKTTPTVLDWTDEMVINYAKRQDILSDHASQIESDIVERLLYNWVNGSTNVGLTTGGARPAGAIGATGNRKKLVLADILALKSAMTKANIPDDGRRVLLLPADMEIDLLEITQVLDSAFINRFPLVDGAVFALFGFQIFVRSRTIQYDPTPGAWVQYKADDTDAYTAGGTDHQLAAVAWHPQFVTRALSSFSSLKLIDTHEGVEMSLKMLAGGESFYSDSKGIYTVIQDAA